MWYDDPTGTAAKVIAFLGSAVALVTVIVGLTNGEATVDDLYPALTPVLVTLIGIYAALQARKTASKPSTVIEAAATGRVPESIQPR